MNYVHYSYDSLSPALSFNCHPNNNGKKKSITHPKPRMATAHSKLVINHSKVNQSNNYNTQVTSEM